MLTIKLCFQVLELNIKSKLINLKSHEKYYHSIKKRILLREEIYMGVCIYIYFHVFKYIAMESHHF